MHIIYKYAYILTYVGALYSSNRFEHFFNAARNEDSMRGLVLEIGAKQEIISLVRPLTTLQIALKKAFKLF